MADDPPAPEPMTPPLSSYVLTVFSELPQVAPVVDIQKFLIQLEL